MSKDINMLDVESYQHGKEAEEKKEEEEEDSSPEPNDAFRSPKTAYNSSSNKHYDWKEYYSQGDGVLNFIRWLVLGASSPSELTAQDDQEFQDKLRSLARLLLLLREYEDRFGIPEGGGPRVQEMILREVTKDLYSGGAPIWALEPVMEKAAEGLTGAKGVNFFLLPRKAFIFAPTSGATTMFRFERGFKIHLLDSMEAIAVRLASFASNTSSVSSTPLTRLPHPEELRKAQRGESVVFGRRRSSTVIRDDREELASEILNLASETYGFFFFINTSQFHFEDTSDTATSGKNMNDDDDIESQETTTISKEKLLQQHHPTDIFWKVEDSTREVFTRLAAMEADKAIDDIDEENAKRELYSPWMTVLFRLGSSAGACAIWFNGSWYDIIVAGLLAVIVARIGCIGMLKNNQERIIFEVVASFSVGLIASLIAIQWPNDTCFGAMAVAGVLDILQGFKVVYSIIELMSKHTVTGGANLLEGILFTGLIAYFLKYGDYVAQAIMGEDRNDGSNSDLMETSSSLACGSGIDPLWYFLFVPVAAVSWSGLFQPNYLDLPLMGMHGILAFLLSWILGEIGSSNENMNNFLAAMAVTLSAGIISRFTGRQAIGNTVAGIYVLLPGAYLVKALFQTDEQEGSAGAAGMFEGIIVRAVIIGIGAWTGTILCSPTLLGTNRGLLAQMGSSIHGNIGISGFSGGNTRRSRRGDRNERVKRNGAMLFF